MPALPWTTLATPDPDAEVLVMGSRLRLRRFRSTLAFVRAALRIQGQLKRSDGLVGFALDAHPLGRTYFTVSAWHDAAALGAFDHSDPHHGASHALHDAVTDTRFVTWRAKASDLPIRFAEVRRRIAEADIGAA